MGEEIGRSGAMGLALTFGGVSSRVVDFLKGNASLDCPRVVELGISVAVAISWEFGGGCAFFALVIRFREVRRREARGHKRALNHRR